MASRPVHVMLVGAHPPDIFDQAGGPSPTNAAQGDQVTAMVLTTGVRSHHWEIIASLMPLPPGQNFTSKFRLDKEMSDV